MIGLRTTGVMILPPGKTLTEPGAFIAGTADISMYHVPGNGYSVFLANTLLSFFLSIVLSGGKNHYVSLLPSKGLVGEITGEVAVQVHIVQREDMKFQSKIYLHVKFTVTRGL